MLIWYSSILVSLLNTYFNQLIFFPLTVNNVTHGGLRIMRFGVVPTSHCFIPVYRVFIDYKLENCMCSVVGMLVVSTCLAITVCMPSSSLSMPLKPGAMPPPRRDKLPMKKAPSPLPPSGPQVRPSKPLPEGGKPPTNPREPGRAGSGGTARPLPPREPGKPPNPREDRRKERQQRPPRR